jgi:hypothetical protein
MIIIYQSSVDILACDGILHDEAAASTNYRAFSVA